MKITSKIRVNKKILIIFLIFILGVFQYGCSKEVSKAPVKSYTAELYIRGANGGTIALQTLDEVRVSNKGLSYSLTPYDILRHNLPDFMDVSENTILFNNLTTDWQIMSWYKASAPYKLVLVVIDNNSNSVIHRDESSDEYIPVGASN